MNRFVFLVLWVTLSMLLSCQHDRPSKDVLDKEELVPLLVDLHMLRAIESSVEYRKIAQQVDSVDSYSYIFEKHGTTKAVFDSSLAWYSRHPGLFTEVYDEVVMNLTRLKDSIESGRME
jgi:hypothetical protein